MISNNSIAPASGATHTAGEGPQADFTCMSVTELLEANKTLLCARHVFALQATRHRAWGGEGGESVRAWAAQHLEALETEIFQIAQELDSRDMANEDEQLERTIALAESYDVLPPCIYEVTVIGSSAA